MNPLARQSREIRRKQAFRQGIPAQPLAYLNRCQHVSTRVDRGIENASLIVEEESVAGEGDSTGLDSDTILVRVDVGISAVGVEFENVVRE